MEQGRPQVTVSDPALRGRAPDVVGDEQPRRRWPWVLVAAALVGGGLVARDAERRADERERTDREGRVALVLDSRVALRDDDGVRLSSRTVLVSLDLDLRNDGPLPVLLDRAVVGDFRFVGDVELDPGAEAQLQLVRTVTCPPDGGTPPLDPLAEGLRVQVVTRGGERTALVSPGVLPLDRLRSTAQRACGFLPMEEAVVVTVVPAPPRGRRVDVTLVLDNVSRRDLQLVQVRLAPGLRLVEPAGVPLPLPERSTASVALQLELACEDGALGLDGEPLPLEGEVVQVVVGDGARRVGPLPTAEPGTAALRDAYAAACS